MTTISDSEANTFNVCTKAHDYAYNQEIEPINKPDYIYRGEIGHLALEAYYFEMKEGGSLSTCKKAADSVITAELMRIFSEQPDDALTQKLLTELQLLIKDYCEFYGDEDFRVIDVEQDFSAELYSGTNFKMRLDMVVEFTRGKFRGDVAVIDHKFPYNFKTERELTLNGQLPKYIKTLKANGYTISKAYFNQIRYRKDAVERFKRSPVRTNSVAIDTVWEEQKKTALAIAELKESGVVRRALTHVACNRCWYADLCTAELNGDDTTQMKRANYKARDRPFKVFDE